MSGLNHAWDEYDNNNHADFIHGGVGVDDFEKEVNYSHKTSKKERTKKKRGCPENDYKAHVYVWITETHYFSKYTPCGYMEDKTRPYTVDIKVCCGCGKIYTRRYNW